MNNKERILQEAIKQFSEYGYTGTSTNKISKALDISEPLIFRHYGNKEGLLKAIFEMGAEQVRRHIKGILGLETVRKKIHALIEFPLCMIDEDRGFWKLSYSMKFQHAQLYDKLSAEDLDHLVLGNLKGRLMEIGVEDIQLEVTNLIVFIEGLIQVSIKHPKHNLRPLIDRWKSKY